MNRKLLIAAALMTGTFAFAQEATPDVWMDASLSKSAAEVRAEAAQARRDGSLRVFGAGYIEPLRGSQTRAEVRAALEQARVSGELAALNAEAYSAPAATPALRLAAQ